MPLDEDSAQEPARPCRPSLRHALALPDAPWPSQPARRAAAAGSVHYERHSPQQTALYRLVQQHAASFIPLSPSPDYPLRLIPRWTRLVVSTRVAAQRVAHNARKAGIERSHW